MSMIKKLYAKQDKFVLLRIVLYPFILAVWSPYRFLATLYNSKVLANGQWSKFNRYRTRNGINSLFYWTQANNIERYGMNGISPALGLGGYQLSRLFHITLPSMYAYRYASAILPLSSMLSWYLMHVIAVETASSNSVLTLLAFTAILFSTTFFAGSFVFLNYNALGWALFPLGIWSLEQENYWVAALSWLGVSFTSTTVLFISGLFIAVYSIYHGDLVPAVSLLPAVLKTLSHFNLTSTKKDEKASITGNIYNMARAIGILGSRAKYKRATFAKKLDIYFFYFIFLYLQFLVVCLYFSVENTHIWVIGILIFLTNKFVSRFADEQSIYMLMFTLATILLLQHVSVVMLVSYWIVASPLPIMLGDGSINEPIGTSPPLAPFKVQGIVDRVSDFLSQVRPGNRVFAAFDDPDESFDKVFNGYRVIHEVPLYVASERSFHCLPDWYAVFDTNYVGAPSLWGRTPEQVIERVKQWKADYVLIYQESGSELDIEWERRGFVPVGMLDWGEVVDQELEGERCWSKHCADPVWWLLSVPK